MFHVSLNLAILAIVSLQCQAEKRYILIEVDTDDLVGLQDGGGGGKEMAKDEDIQRKVKGPYVVSLNFVYARTST